MRTKIIPIFKFMFFVSFTFNACNGLNLLSLATVLFYQKCQPIFFWNQNNLNQIGKVTPKLNLDTI